MLFLATALAALAGPTMIVHDVPLHAVRTPAAATQHFNLVGLHWRGSGSVEFRTRSDAGRWSSWRGSDDDDRIQEGWHLGNLDWTGAANAIRFRTHGAVTQLRAYYVWSPV